MKLRDSLQRAFSFSTSKARDSASGAGRVAADTPLLLYRSSSMKEVMANAQRVSPVKATVLITGESGTGKDLLAREIHRLSGRSGLYTAINCSAIPETLLEDELFGHEQGAFTGAERSREGRFEASSGGTLLLDEIGELSPATQVKLLRVLEEEQVTRLGGNTPVPIDVRLIAATNSNLDSLIKSGSFRKDLYYRMVGWDEAGKPTRAKLQELALGWLAEEMGL